MPAFLGALNGTHLRAPWKSAWQRTGDQVELDLHLDPLFTDKAGLGFGGDLEGTGFVWKGFYLRLGLGAAGVPVASGDRSISVGVGGRAGLGYEFFLNQTVAMSVGADYDLRMVSGGGAVSAALVGVRIIWY